MYKQYVQLYIHMHIYVYVYIHTQTHFAYMSDVIIPDNKCL